MLSFYPTWTRINPGFTKELLAIIGYKCKTGQALDAEERAYLADSIAKILSGVPAARALHLTAAAQKRRETFSERNVLIFNRVEELVESGYSKNKAFEQVSTEPIAAWRGRPENLSPKAIEKAYSAIRTYLDRKARLFGR
jgi:hypothetical protein